MYQNQSNNIIHQEKLRHVRAAFKLAYTFLAINGIMVAASLVLLFSGKISEGKVVASEAQIYGSISLLLLKSAKDASKKLDEDK